MDSTMPATIVHLMTRHHAERYEVAARVDPETMTPNSQTQQAIHARMPNSTRS